MEWLSYEEAKEFVQKLGLKSQKEWIDYIKSENKPNNIPSYPYSTYKKKGWVSFGDFLGTRTIANQNKEWLPYEEAREFVHKLKLKNQKEWEDYCKSGNKPDNIPNTIYTTYKNKGLIDLSDFLGSKNKKGKFLSYEEAKEFTSKLGLRTKSEWTQYCKSNNKPSDIPANPTHVYKNKGWISWSDFLNTDFIASQNKIFISYEEAIEFVHKLNLKSQTEWNEYCKSGNKPNNIPNSPYSVYKNKGWVSWGEFLGTGIIASYYKEYLSYEQAKEFVHKLNLSGQAEWENYSKSRNKPDNIPANPSGVYKNKGWISWGDFLGTGNVHVKFREYLSYQEAKEFIYKIHLKDTKEWFEYCKSGNKPDNIPNYPDHVYKNKGWISWGDFLGNGNIATFNREYVSFQEAREFVIKLGLKGKQEWHMYCKSGNKPDNIPSNLNQTYKNKGWINWGDFLGTGTIANQNKKYLTYEEAREIVMKLNLKSNTEWKEYCKSGNKPDDVPTYANETYENEGWKGWAHFLGYLGNGNVWNQSNIIVYLEEIKDYLHTCDIPELLSIIESNGLYNFLTNEKLKKIQETKPCSKERTEVINELTNELKTKTEEEFENTIKDDEIKEVKKEQVENNNEVDIIEENNNNDIIEENNNDKVGTIEEETQKELRYLKSLEIDSVTASLDDERVEFLVTNRINKLWYQTINNEIDLNVIKQIDLTKETPLRIVNEFFNEYNEVNNLIIPEEYIFEHQPLLMQKLIAFRLLKHKRYGNWSGVGAGKTIGAILAGLYVEAKNTLIITFNSTIGQEDQRGWTNVIKTSVKDANIYTKTDNTITFDEGYNYLVLNYESFQQANSANYVIDLLERNKFDYIVLDEVQSVKHRENNNQTSKRREVILGLITKVKQLNPDYYLLAMSATPVINNLVEAKSIIELITKEELDNVDTRPTISNCFELFRRLTNIGIRHKNIEDNILKNNQHTLLEINGDELYEEACLIPYDNYLDKEKLILHHKLKAIKPYLNTSVGKTIIYCHYVDYLVDETERFLKELGFKVCTYTGDIISKQRRNDIITDFIKGDYDILIGSRPIGTGVDGLQFVADRLIVLSCPWTNSEMEQLVGRINRKGSKFNQVDVIIPLVSIKGNDKTFEWDKHKYNLITYKATIANAAVDGIIPDKIIISKDKLEEDSSNKLDQWLDRLKQGDFLTVDRKELNVQLYPELTNEQQRQLRLNSELQEFNRIAKVSHSSTTHKRFKDNPNEWIKYHQLRRESMKDWNEIPYEVIAKKIKKKNAIVADFGCGENLFKTLIPNKVISFDHVAIDDSVIACDMSDLSLYLENESIDVAVFSLSLWGTNYKDYIKEAYRVLNFTGFIYIAEPVKNYEQNGEEQKLIDVIIEQGFDITKNNSIQKTDKFIYISGIKL